MYLRVSCTQKARATHVRAGEDGRRARLASCGTKICAPIYSQLSAVLKARQATFLAQWTCPGAPAGPGEHPSEARGPRREEVGGRDRPAHALRRWSSAGTARPINIRVAKTSCTRAVDGSGLSIGLGSCVAGMPHRLDKVDWVWLPRGHRQRQLQSWLAPRRGGEELARLWPRRPRLRLHCG